MLLDNQSSVHIMCNPDFVDNVREASQQMVLKSNGGKLPINEVADFEGFKRETWFSRGGMAKWRNGNRIAEWRNGNRMAELRNGGKANW